MLEVLNSATPFLYSFYEFMILSLLYLLELLALSHAAPLALSHAAPQVQLGNTTLVGLDITGFKLDFFGGMIFTIFLSAVRGSRLFYRNPFRRASHR